MLWCPECNTEYEAGRLVCSDCGAILTDEPRPTDEDPVVVLHAQTANEARIAEATLEAEGISAYVQPPDTVLPQYGNVVDDDNPELDVLVSADSAEEAAAVLNEPPVSEEELAALAEGDTSGTTGTV
jgi:hypothetical protein